MINKTIYFWAIIPFLSSCLSSNCDDNKYLETASVEVLDGMSSSIGALNACSFTLQVSSESLADSGGVVVYEAESNVYMRGPDKFYIHTNSNHGNRGYWYDGNLLSWFNYDKNVFDTLPAPETIMQTINAAHENYGVDFPASDFFYPTFTDDIISQFDSVFYMGNEKVGAENISEILTINPNLRVTMWIANNGTHSYPVGFSIIRFEKEKEIHYLADFSNWRFNPVLPDDLFEFSPPENATRIPIQPLKK